MGPYFYELNPQQSRSQWHQIGTTKPPNSTFRSKCISKGVGIHRHPGRGGCRQKHWRKRIRAKEGQLAITGWKGKRGKLKMQWEGVNPTQAGMGFATIPGFQPTLLTTKKNTQGFHWNRIFAVHAVREHSPSFAFSALLHVASHLQSAKNAGSDLSGSRTPEGAPAPCPFTWLVGDANRTFPCGNPQSPT